LCDDKKHSRLERDAERAASAIKAASDVLVVAHIDADGICAAAIASKTLERLGKTHNVLFVKKLDDDAVGAVNGSKTSLVWLVDLGSGYLSSIKRSNVVVSDHHVPDPKWMSGQTSLFDFTGLVHVNPHNSGMDGSGEISGAGVTYVISKIIDPVNVDLAYLAVVGASGDVQDQAESKFVGYNRKILQDAVDNGDIEITDDLRLFGRETRPLVQFLQFCNDPVLPGITSDSVGCMDLFDSLNINLKDNGKWRSWNSLSDDERDAVKITLIELIERAGGNAGRLMGEVYTLPRFEKGTELRDAKEYATLLNSCGRYDDAETGMRICLGDKEALADAAKNRSEHRKQLSNAMNYIKQNNIIRVREFVQHFHGGNEIRDTIIGIAAGMVLGSDGVRNDIPIIAFANAEDGVKVSARADKSLAVKGLDLSIAVKTAAEKVGGFGGGHNVAAGATIPAGKEYEFVHIIESIIRTQIT